MPDDEELDPFAKAEETFEAAAEGKASIVEAREAMLLINDYRPRGMDPEESGPKDSPERLFSDAANSFKMALDALESEQQMLAKSYVKVAKIKLEKARNS